MTTAIRSPLGSALAFAAAWLGLALSGAAAAQSDFPSRPVTITVGFAPGGGTDTAAPAMQKNLPYDVKRDIAPITMAVVFPNVFVVHPGVPAKTLAEFVKLAKDKGDLTYASSGVGGAAHLAGELFKQRAGIDLVHVPYKGGGPAMTDLLGGRGHMYPAVPATSKPHIDTGKLQPIATTGLKRTAIMPDVPTVAESGYPGFEATNWYAFVASSKVPKDILAFWSRELVKALEDPEVASALARHGLEPMPGSPEDLARYIDSETQKWSKVVRDAKISAD